MKQKLRRHFSSGWGQTKRDVVFDMLVSLCESSFTNISIVRHSYNVSYNIIFPKQNSGTWLSRVIFVNLFTMIHVDNWMKNTKQTLSSMYKHQCFDMLPSVHLFTQWGVMIAIYQQFISNLNHKNYAIIPDGSRKRFLLGEGWGGQTKSDVVFASPLTVMWFVYVSSWSAVELSDR